MLDLDFDFRVKDNGNEMRITAFPLSLITLIFFGILGSLTKISPQYTFPHPNYN
jgi:hypothetical protein